MGKLGNKEVILILVVINFLLYYLLFMMVINPTKNKIKSNNENIETLQAEYDEKKAIVDSEQSYIDNIEKLKVEKAELFTKGFPNTDPENLHAFMVKETAANSITINSINISQASRNAADAEGGQHTTGIMDNTLAVSIEGSYANIVKLIGTMEEINKTSLLTSLSLSGDPTKMTTTLNYSFLSADKSDNPDNIFDYTFNKGVGNSALFKEGQR